MGNDKNSAAYFLDEIASAEVTTRETWGAHNWTAKLYGFFGDYFIYMNSYSRADKINLSAHSHADAVKEFERFVKLHDGKILENA